jgi:hypothetical protein
MVRRWVDKLLAIYFLRRLEGFGSSGCSSLKDWEEHSTLLWWDDRWKRRRSRCFSLVLGWSAQGWTPCGGLDDRSQKERWEEKELNEREGDKRDERSSVGDLQCSCGYWGGGIFGIWSGLVEETLQDLRLTYPCVVLSLIVVMFGYYYWMYCGDYIYEKYYMVIFYDGYYLIYWFVLVLGEIVLILWCWWL